MEALEIQAHFEEVLKEKEEAKKKIADKEELERIRREKDRRK